MDALLDEAYRKRVRLLRKLHGMTQVEWSEFTGIPYKRWHHYERGYPVSRESLFILRIAVKGFSADWLYWGDPSGLSKGTLSHLRRLQREDRRAPHPGKNGILHNVGASSGR